MKKPINKYVRNHPYPLPREATLEGGNYISHANLATLLSFTLNLYAKTQTDCQGPKYVLP